jgi:hypothetical protein
MHTKFLSKTLKGIPAWETSEDGIKMYFKAGYEGVNCILFRQDSDSTGFLRWMSFLWRST